MYEKGETISVGTQYLKSGLFSFSMEFIFFNHILFLPEAIE